MITIVSYYLKTFVCIFYWNELIIYEVHVKRTSEINRLWSKYSTLLPLHGIVNLSYDACAFFFFFNFFMKKLTHDTLGSPAKLNITELFTINAYKANVLKCN